MLGVSGDGAQRLRRCPEQDIVDNGLVLERDDLNLRRHGEHDVEIGVTTRFVQNRQGAADLAVPKIAALLAANLESRNYSPPSRGSWGRRPPSCAAGKTIVS
jgi:hypothetical protein